MHKKKGVLLVNLGTPEAPTISGVRRYLRAFLSDSRVLDIPWPLRMVLLYGVILPFRPFKTAEAYQQIWDAEKGSPLLFHSDNLANKLQATLGEDYRVRLAMRYGQPALKEVLNTMIEEVDHLRILPLYPQYASSTNGSVLAACASVFQSKWNIPQVEWMSHFYDASWYREALARSARPYLDTFKPDHVLMSFHGLPVRQVQKSESKVCAQTHACPEIHEGNRYCYRAQCYDTARGLSLSLNLKGHYSVAFQSRLGRIPWIRPYTDETLKGLRDRGVERLSVMCPSFITDCLETLEEIGIRLKAQWLGLGGQAFQLIPCLNDQAHWVDSLAHFIQQEDGLVFKPKNPFNRSIAVL